MSKWGKLRLRFSPYTYVRVAVMKSLLLGRSEYDKLLKMGYYEAVRFIADSQYRRQVEEFKVSGSDPLVVEAALNANLMETFAKLFRISDERMRKVVQVYALRYDLENVKSVVRSKFAKVPAGAVAPLLYHSVNYGRLFYDDLLAKDTAQMVVGALPFLKGVEVDSSRLIEVENALDRYYVEAVSSFAEGLGGDGAYLAEFLREEVELININTLLQLRGLDGAQRQSYLIRPSKLVEQLSVLNGEGEIVEALRKHKKTQLRGDEDDVLQRLEIDLQVSLLRRESLLMHKHPVSVNQVVGFMLAKEIEVKNLKALLKGKLLGVDARQLEGLLVVAR